MSYTDNVLLDYRPQRVWTSPVDLNLFLAGTGAGAYVWGVLWGNWVAEAVGVVAVALAGLVTRGELGKPGRAWRALARVGGSWMSRGVLFLSLFVVLGAVSVLPAIPGLGGIPWGTGTAAGAVLRTLAAILALGVTFYSGMLLSTWPSIPFWNTPLLPLMMMAFSFACGGAVLLAVLSLQSAGSMLVQVEVDTLYLTGICAVSALLYLATMAPSTLASRAAVRMILRGERRVDFYGGLGAVGLVLPLVLLWVDSRSGAEPGGTGMRLVAVGALLVGGYMVRRIWLRAGVYGLPL
jgi:sulfite dehydrogenase (quinone) subunit SoeC